MEIIYSTPLDNINSLKKENVEWPVISHDYFPYA